MKARGEVASAIEASWSLETSATPDEWTASNPAMGQCEVSSFVAWEFLGGDLVQGEVYVDGEFREYHYWNRIDGVDLDLTSSQFTGFERIVETRTLTSAFLTANRSKMRRPELKARIDLFRQLVERQLRGS